MFKVILVKSEKENNEIWHWNDKTKQRVKVQKSEDSILGKYPRVTYLDLRSDAEKLLEKFEKKWHIGYFIILGDESIRENIKKHLTEYPNKNKKPPKKKIFEKNRSYQKRCNEFERVTIEPSEVVVNYEFNKWKLEQQIAINSDKYKQLQYVVKGQNKKQYFELIEMPILNDYDAMKNAWAKIQDCCEKDESLKEHYLSLQLKKENTWLAEKEKRNFEKKKRAELKEKKDAEKKAMFARANEESRLLGTKIKFKLRRDHNCPYCRGDLGAIPHADHIIPIAQGGLSVKHNMVYVCESCNLSKSDLTLFEFTQKKGLDYMEIIKTLQKLSKRI